MVWVVPTGYSFGMAGLTHLEIMRIINLYIGVSGGYLGDFSYGTHADFYSKYVSERRNAATTERLKTGHCR